MLIKDVFDVVSIAVSVVIIGMVLSRKLAAIDRALDEIDRKAARLPPVLRRPDLRPRWRFPFRSLRSVSLWVILVVLASRGSVRCTPDLQPTLSIIDCDRDWSAVAQIRCSLATEIVLDVIERRPR